MAEAIKVQDIMTADPMVTTPNATVEEAYTTMKRLGFRHMPVVDKGRLVGVISTTDVGRLGSTIPELMARPVAHAMTPDPLTIAPDATIEVAAAQMGLKKINCLPVVSEGRLIGIVTTYDLLDALVRRPASV
ncbi:MAG: CBS domain-containing protein [Polyangiaceae bacterium]